MESNLPDADPQCRVGFVFALGAEAGGLVDQMQGFAVHREGGLRFHTGAFGGAQVTLVESGVGEQAAGRAARILLDSYQPDWLISAGFAGALSDNLKQNDILMAREVVNLQGQSLEIGLTISAEAIASVAGLHAGRLLTVDRLIKLPEEKRELGRRFDALACDMETFAVAAVAAEFNVRFLAVRVVSDTADRRLPDDIEILMQQTTGASRLGAAAGALFRRPSSIKDMWQLKEDALKASDRLAAFLAGVVPRLNG